MLAYNNKVCIFKLASKMYKCIKDEYSTANMNFCEVFEKINMVIDYNLS